MRTKKDMDKTRNRINEIYKAKEDLDREFEELQAKCTHSHYHIRLFSWRPGNISTSRLCVYCDKNLGHASDTEEATFTNENVNGEGKTKYENIPEKPAEQI
jgi:hypothetical protein